METLCSKRKYTVVGSQSPRSSEIFLDKFGRHASKAWSKWRRSIARHVMAVRCWPARREPNGQSLSTGRPGPGAHGAAEIGWRSLVLVFPVAPVRLVVHRHAQGTCRAASMCVAWRAPIRAMRPNGRRCERPDFDSATPVAVITCMPISSRARNEPALRLRTTHRSGQAISKAQSPAANPNELVHCPANRRS